MSEALIGVGELAKRLDVSENTIRAWVKQGYIPRHACFVIGPQVRRYDYNAIIEHWRQGKPVPKKHQEDQLTLDFGDNA
jgi:excisionase family DNA binding protein